MRIVVLGASGQAGSAVVTYLNSQEHEVISASRANGIDIISGQGVSQAFTGADAVIDCLNTTITDPVGLTHFFTTAANNLVHYARESHVKHVILLSIVGSDRMAKVTTKPEGNHSACKVIQEGVLAASGLPYTIVRAAEFFELIEWMTNDAVSGGDVKIIRIPNRPFRPMDVSDLGKFMGRVVSQTPARGVVNVVGPQVLSLSEAARTVAAVKTWRFEIVDDNEAVMLGYLRLTGDELLPEKGANVTVAEMTLDQWLQKS